MNGRDPLRAFLLTLLPEKVPARPALVRVQRALMIRDRHRGAEQRVFECDELAEPDVQLLHHGFVELAIRVPVLGFLFGGTPPSFSKISEDSEASGPAYLNHDFVVTGAEQLGNVQRLPDGYDPRILQLALRRPLPDLVDHSLTQLLAVAECGESKYPPRVDLPKM